MQQRRGKVTSLDGQEATLLMDDGSTLTLSVPEMIQVEVGMPMLVVDVGDGKPIVRWGS
jgi:hypothetical protein